MSPSVSRQAVRWCVVAVVLASCVGCDQFTKRVAQSHLKGRLPHSYCGDVFRLQYAENPGAFLGLGGDLPATARTIVLIGFNGLIAIGLVVAVALGWHFSVWQLVGCALLLAGAIGNLIDRLRFDGLVIDFMNLGVGPLRSGIFNVADVAIVVGALALALPLAAAPPAAASKSSGE
ncbi:MAG: signal peptidase II [Pirellulales bacterium]